MVTVTFLCISAGIYVCSHCAHPLFSSNAKYAHRTPWPAFSRTIQSDSLVKYKEGPRALKVGDRNNVFPIVNLCTCKHAGMKFVIAFILRFHLLSVHKFIRSIEIYNKSRKGKQTTFCWALQCGLICAAFVIHWRSSIQFDKCCKPSLPLFYYFILRRFSLLLCSYIYAWSAKMLVCDSIDTV